VNQQMTVSDFLSINFNNYKAEDGSRLKLGQRVAMKMFQKKIAKQVRKGKIEGTSPFFDFATGEGYSNRTGRMSLIFSSVGLLMLFHSLPGDRWIRIGNSRICSGNYWTQKRY
jgi:hypothetical protein